ncbi:MAG TPA: hypothetical protein EYP10_04665, partial [Armatimonadetes bacterium]|nr:hypothetical protein [Armatimonadota bacterium]
EKFPFPTKGDLRWRPIVNTFSDRDVYVPLITLKDEEGRSYGDGAALIEIRTGKLKGARLLYVWHTLLLDPQRTTAIISDVFRYFLTHTLPPPEQHVCIRALKPIKIDGVINEDVWKQTTPVTLQPFMNKDGQVKHGTRAWLAWDETNLYVAFECEDTDVWATKRQRDDSLWEEEVVEVYIDPDGDGRNYKEFEVNPLGALIDLNIPEVRNGKIGDWRKNAQWDAQGWRVAVRVNGTVDNRSDRDKGWTVEMAISWRDLLGSGVSPRIGDVMRVQLFRIDRSKDLKEPEFTSWSLTDTFHNPERFGRLILGGNPCYDDFALYPNGADGAPTWRIKAGRWRVQDGVFIGENSGTDAWQALGAHVGSPHWRDYTLRLRFRIIERGSDWRDGVWIGFRHSDLNNSYSVNFHARYIALHKASQGVASSDGSELATVPWTPDDKW